MRNGLCKIPTDLSQKYEFPELTYCQAVLKEQKRVVKQIDEALSSLKKAYQAQAATIGPLSNISYRQIALESARFRHFVEARQQLASQFSKYSVDITNLRASKVAPLRSSLSERYKGIVADIAKMRSSMSEPIEKLTKEVKSHEKSIAGVVAAGFVASGVATTGSVGVVTAGSAALDAAGSTTSGVVTAGSSTDGVTSILPGVLDGIVIFCPVIVC